MNEHQITYKTMHVRQTKTFFVCSCGIEGRYAYLERANAERDAAEHLADRTAVKA